MNPHLPPAITSGSHQYLPPGGHGMQPDTRRRSHDEASTEKVKTLSPATMNNPPLTPEDIQRDHERRSSGTIRKLALEHHGKTFSTPSSEFQEPERPHTPPLAEYEREIEEEFRLRISETTIHVVNQRIAELRAIMGHLVQAASVAMGRENQDRLVELLVEFGVRVKVWDDVAEGLREPVGSKKSTAAVATA